jgi:hypothetical protein
MAKRKHSENHAAAAPAPAAVASDVAAHAADELSAERLGELAEEVRAFIDRREELAGKLAQEIALTEKKLAELKRTAALLFPENATNGHGDALRLERKPKKLGLGKTAKPSQDAAVDEPQSIQHSAAHSTTSHHTRVELPAAEASTSQASEGLGGTDAHGNPI